MTKALSEIIKALKPINCNLKKDINITSLASLSDAKEGDISFLTNTKYIAQLSSTCASAVLVKPEHADIQSNAILIIVDNPNLAFAEVAKLLGFERPVSPMGISDKACIAKDAHISNDVKIQAYSVIASGVSIGESTNIYPNVVIENNVKIGKYCTIYPNVTIMDGCEIGDNVIINAGSVIGSDGFGFDLESPDNTKIPQVGNVIIGNNVEIGANVSIDRARFGSTIIQDNVKIDNLVQIAHNVVIGKNSVIVSQTGIAGSSKLGTGVIVGGCTAISGHLRIADNSMFAGRSGVTKSITNAGIYAGLPAQPINSWRKDIANIRSLHKIKKHIKDLKERILKIEHNTPKNT